MKSVKERIESAPPIAELDPTPVEQAAFLEDVRSGTNPSEAAAKLPCEWHATGHRTASQFGRLGRRNPAFAAAYGEALAERETLMAFRVEKLVEDRAFEKDAPAGIVLGLAAAWSSRFRREQQRGGADEPGDLLSAPPSINVDNLTDEEMEELERCVARVHELAAVARERVGRPAGEIPPSTE